MMEDARRLNNLNESYICCGESCTKFHSSMISFNLLRADAFGCEPVLDFVFIYIGVQMTGIWLTWTFAQFKYFIFFNFKYIAAIKITHWKLYPWILLWFGILFQASNRLDQKPFKMFCLLSNRFFSVASIQLTCNINLKKQLNAFGKGVLPEWNHIS